MLGIHTDRTICAVTLAGMALAVGACKRTERRPDATDSAKASATAGDTSRAIASVPGVSSPTDSGSAWLDTQLKSWNAAGAQIPSAPKAEEPGVYSTGGRCAKGLPMLTSYADSAVAAKGWTPVASTQKIGNTQIVTASVDADGMCRPFKYQTFVFINNAYAGTLSPVVMSSRTDGALSVVEAAGPDGLDVSFNRYTSSDPLCCPSRTTAVNFHVVREGQPVVVPVRAVTRATQQQPANANQ